MDITQQTQAIEITNLSCSFDSQLQDSTIKKQQQSSTFDISSSDAEKRNTKIKLKKQIKKSNKKKEQPLEDRIMIIKDTFNKGTQLYINIELSKVFPIQGDYFVNLDYDKKLSIEEQISLFKGYKQILVAVKDDKRQMVILDIVTSDGMDYAPQEVVYEAIQKRQDPLLFTFQSILQEYYKQLFLHSKMQEKLNQMMSQTIQDNLKERRRNYFDQKMEEYIKDNFTDTDFYLYYKYQQRKPNEAFMQYRQVGVSYPLIALLGTDPSSFINICMRNGFLEFSSNIDKQMMIIHSMACRLNLQQTEKHPLHVVKEMVLLTFDEYEIHTQMVVSCFKFEYPPELEMQVDGYNFIHEVPVFLKYNIDQNTLQCLIAKRAKNPQFQQQWENEQFGYTLESQMFLEKHYKDLTKNLEESKFEHQFKYYYNKECNYKSTNFVEIDPSCCCKHYQKTFS